MILSDIAVNALEQLSEDQDALAMIIGMNTTVPSFLFLLLTTAALSQSGAVGSAGELPQTGSGRQLVIHGKVVVEGGGGAAAGEAADVVLECGTKEQARVESDLSGEFWLNVIVPGSYTESSPVIPEQGLENCELHAQVAGYTSDHVYPFSGTEPSMIRAATIRLHPLGTSEGSATSVNSLAAPEDAKRAVRKGMDQQKKGKWAQACSYFRNAIKAYPRYALAWLELGRSQVKLNNFVDARTSFTHATAYDPHFLEAYAETARLAVAQKHWTELADATDQLLQLSPNASATWWFLNAVARYNLGNIGPAESSAVRGLRLDAKRQIPQLEYVYGMILAKRAEYVAAAAHIRAYLQLSPYASDAAETRIALAEFQKLAETKDSKSGR
jgi:hypothetical protein